MKFCVVSPLGSITRHHGPQVCSCGLQRGQYTNCFTAVLELIVILVLVLILVPMNILLLIHLKNVNCYCHNNDKKFALCSAGREQ